VVRVGGTRPIAVNVRILCATHCQLERQVREGRFRADLFYRLSVFPLELPPLRERREDKPQLTAHFVTQVCTRLHLSQSRIPQREMDRLQEYGWPGNVRELQNVVERAVILAQGGPLHFEPGRAVLRSPEAEHRNGFYTENEWQEKERQNLLHALQAARGRVSGAGGAAELLQVNPNTLASRLRALGITRSHSTKQIDLKYGHGILLRRGN
jgi:transcriptional regulator with GAF, ATPase, and Fis domain